MSPQIIEALGKVGIGIVAIVVLGYILNTVLVENSKVIEALNGQMEMSKQQTELNRRQTEALERLVTIYSGGAK